MFLRAFLVAGGPLPLVDLLSEGLKHPSARFHLAQGAGRALGAEAVTQPDLAQVLSEAFQGAFLVLELGEGELALAPLAGDLLAEALGLIHHFLVFLVAGGIEAIHDFLLPDRGWRCGILYCRLTAILLDPAGKAAKRLLIAFGTRQEADSMLQGKRAQAFSLAPDRRAGRGRVGRQPIDQ